MKKLEFLRPPSENRIYGRGADNKAGLAGETGRRKREF
jgi:hypothetical protein